jgi:hypothetical protein
MKSFDVECIVHGKMYMDPVAKMIMAKILADDIKLKLVFMVSRNLEIP